MGPTVFTTVCLVSGGEVVMETGGKTVSILPKVWASHNLSCSVHGSANPRVQERRLPSPPHSPSGSVRGEAVVASSVQTGLLTEAVWQVWAGTVVNRTCNRRAFSRGSVCFDSPLYQLHMLSLVQLSGDRDPQLWRKPVRICSKTSEADVNVVCSWQDFRKAEVSRSMTPCSTPKHPQTVAKAFSTLFDLNV